MEFKLDDTGSQGVLHLEGDLTIERAGTLKDGLVQALEKAKQVILEIEKVREMDVACLQVLCSAHRTYIKSGQSLSFSGPLSEEFIKSMEKAGFDRERGCPLDRSTTCLFVIGG